MADASRVAGDGGRQIVEPTTDGGRRCDPRPMVEKPQLETGQFPPHPLSVQGRIPARQIGHINLCEPSQGTEGAPSKTFALSFGSTGKSSLRFVFAKVLKHRPTSRGVETENVRHPHAPSGAPRPDLEIPGQLTPFGRRVADQDRGPTALIPDASVASAGCITTQAILAHPRVRQFFGHQSPREMYQGSTMR